MLLQEYALRIVKGVKRRLYKIHPKALWYDYYCKKNPDKPLIVNIENDIKIRIWPNDVIGKDIYVHSSFEDDEVSYIKKNLKPGMAFFDIGANIGYYSLLASNLVGNTGVVHSFEPSPRMFEELKFNIGLNKVGNAYQNKLALSDHCGVGNLSRYERGKEVFGSLSERSFPGFKVLGYDEVTLGTLDDYVYKNKIKNIDFIKMDVEGAELLVLKGGKKTLEELKPKNILFEFVKVNSDGFGYGSNDIFDYLREFGYFIHTVSHNGRLLKINKGQATDRYFSNFIAKIDITS